MRQYSDFLSHGEPTAACGMSLEREALRRLRRSKGRELVHEFTELDGQPVVRYAQARVMERSCVECHSTHDQSPRKDWRVGDVRGVPEIIRPLDKDEARVGVAPPPGPPAGAHWSRARPAGGKHARGEGRPQTLVNLIVGQACGCRTRRQHSCIELQINRSGSLNGAVLRDRQGRRYDQSFCGGPSQPPLSEASRRRRFTRAIKYEAPIETAFLARKNPGHRPGTLWGSGPSRRLAC